MGEAYLAQDTRLDRKVALKILPADLAANEDRMRRFVLEAKSGAAPTGDRTILLLPKVTCRKTILVSQVCLSVS